MYINVLSAIYGTNTKGSDVTSIVKKILGDNEFIKTIGDNSLNNIDKPKRSSNTDVIKITNETMGGDPDVNVQKRFAIIYSIDGGPTNALTALEGDNLKLV